MLIAVLLDAIRLLALCLRLAPALAAENPRSGPGWPRYRILIHDRDSIFSKAVDQGVLHMGLHMIKTPVQMPVANARAAGAQIERAARDCQDARGVSSVGPTNPSSPGQRMDDKLKAEADEMWRFRQKKAHSLQALPG
jgi:hypothetical protein